MSFFTVIKVKDTKMPSNQVGNPPNSTLNYPCPLTNKNVRLRTDQCIIIEPSVSFSGICDLGMEFGS